MRIHLLTIDMAQQFGQVWKITPSVRLRSLLERGPTLKMPMAGDEIELVLPDGQTITAFIASFGIDAWKDSEGNLYVNSDPADPSLTLTIMCESDLGGAPPGTEIWLRNARSDSASDDL